MGYTKGLSLLSALKMSGCPLLTDSSEKLGMTYDTLTPYPTTNWLLDM